MILGDSITRACAVLAVCALMSASEASGQGARLTADEETLFVMACELEFLGRASEPSSYLRQASTPIEVASGSLAEFLGIETPEKYARVMAENLSDPKLALVRQRRGALYAQGRYERISVSISYSMDDESGQRTSDDMTCHEYILKGEAWSNMGLHMPSVDGFTHLEWVARHSAAVSE